MENLPVIHFFIIAPLYIKYGAMPVGYCALRGLLDRETVRNHFKRYRKGGIEALRQNEAGGSQALLSDEQQRALDEHLKEHFYLTAKEVAHFVKQTWDVSYSESGITQLLKRMGYVYKKPKLVPGKANAEKQREFIERYHELKETQAPKDPIYFMEAAAGIEPA